MATLEELIKGEVQVDRNPFFLHTVGGPESAQWKDGGTTFKLKSTLDSSVSDSKVSYFVVAVKQGCRVKMSLRSTRWDRWNDIPDDPHDDGTIYPATITTSGLGGDGTITFDMLGGDFIEICNTAPRYLKNSWGGRPPNWSLIVDEGINTNLSGGTCMRFSMNQGQVFQFEAIRAMTGKSLYIKMIDYEILDPESEGGSNEATRDFESEAGEQTVVPKLNEYEDNEIIFDKYGHQWAIGKTDETWLFFFDGERMSAAGTRDGIVEIVNDHFHHWEDTKIEDERIELGYDGASGMIGIAAMVWATRWLGGFL